MQRLIDAVEQKHPGFRVTQMTAVPPELEEEVIEAVRNARLIPWEELNFTGP